MGIPALPFCHLRLKGSRAPDFAIPYARVPKSLGDHLRKERLLRGLRQRDLAAMLGVGQETVANWEKGKVRPLTRHYAAVIRFLGSDPEPTSPSIGGRLVAIRRRLGLTQAELAARVGLDEGSICRWEAGGRRPCGWMAGRLEAILTALEGNDSIASLHSYDLTDGDAEQPPGRGR